MMTTMMMAVSGDIAGTKNTRTASAVGCQQPGLCGQRQLSVIIAAAISPIIVIISSSSSNCEVSVKPMSDGESTLSGMSWSTTLSSARC